MSRIKFISMVDTIFISASTFVLVFAWINFYISNLFLSLITSAIVSSCVLFFLNFLRSKSKAKKAKITNDFRMTENYALNFQLYSETQKLKTIAKFIDDKYEYKIHTNYIAIDETKAYILVANSVEKLNSTMLLQLIKSYINKANQIIIFTNNYDDEAMKLSKKISNIKIKLLNKIDFYSLCNIYNIEIKEIIKTSKGKKALSYFFKSFFSRKHCKGFLFTGIIILFTSLIIPFKTYYIIWGSLLVIFSLICILPKFKEVKRNWLDF